MIWKYLISFLNVTRKIISTSNISKVASQGQDRVTKVGTHTRISNAQMQICVQQSTEAQASKIAKVGTKRTIC